MPRSFEVSRSTKDRVIGPLQSPHHEWARLDMPIGIPANGVVALARQQYRLIGAPCHGELVFSAEVGNAAEIEDDDLVYRILPLRAQESVVDERDERTKHNSRRHKGDCQPL